jgi:hypothetical protein
MTELENMVEAEAKRIVRQLRTQMEMQPTAMNLQAWQTAEKALEKFESHVGGDYRCPKCHLLNNRRARLEGVYGSDDLRCVVCGHCVPWLKEAH